MYQHYFDTCCSFAGMLRVVSALLRNPTVSLKGCLRSWPLTGELAAPGLGTLAALGC